MTNATDLLLRPGVWLTQLSPEGFAVLTFVLMTAAGEIGYRSGRRSGRRRADAPALRDSIGFITGGMHALFAFLLSVTFSLSAERLELRAQSVLAEANAIGTLWTRAAVMGEEAMASVRATLRSYAGERADAVTLAGRNADAARVAARSQALQAQLEAEVLRFVRTAPNATATSVLAALNEVSDRAAITDWNLVAGVPRHVLRLLLVVGVLSVGAMGYQFGLGANRQFFVTTLLLLTWTVTLLLVLDIDAAHWGALCGEAAPLRTLLAGWGPDP